ncbi:MAG: nucleotide exchange factor GrpE [Acidobacteria bacterium]|nr:nucleotide exchange factor GrpE [Acidobacteriota bacterium]
MEESNPVAETVDPLAERDQLVQEKAELESRLLRRQADFENLRRRVERERAELAEYIGMESVGPLLPIADDFERALKVECADKEYARGMELIYQRLLETLGKLGLEPIEAVGRPFDPNLHHAVDMVQTAEADDQTVLDEYQRGYNFRGRLLRPSMVRVAVQPRNEDQ